MTTRSGIRYKPKEMYMDDILVEPVNPPRLSYNQVLKQNPEICYVEPVYDTYNYHPEAYLVNRVGLSFNCEGQDYIVWYYEGSNQSIDWMSSWARPKSNESPPFGYYLEQYNRNTHKTYGSRVDLLDQDRSSVSKSVVATDLNAPLWKCPKIYKFVAEVYPTIRDHYSPSRWFMSSVNLNCSEGVEQCKFCSAWWKHANED